MASSKGVFVLVCYIDHMVQTTLFRVKGIVILLVNKNALILFFYFHKTNKLSMN